MTDKEIFNEFLSLTMSQKWQFMIYNYDINNLDIYFFEYKGQIYSNTENEFFMNSKDYLFLDGKYETEKEIIRFFENKIIQEKVKNF